MEKENMFQVLHRNCEYMGNAWDSETDFRYVTADPMEEAFNWVSETLNVR